MTAPNIAYTIRKSITDRLLGLDNSTLPTNGLGGVVQPVGEYAPYLMGQDLRGVRMFFPGDHGKAGADYKECIRVTHNDKFDDFLGAAFDTFTWNANKGSDGATNVAIVAAANNGVARLTTGAGSTHTMAVNGAQITSARNILVSDNGTRFEARAGNLSAAASQSICMGLADVTTLTAPFTLTTATVTANGTNGAAFLQDAAGTNTGLNCVAVNAGGSPQVVAIAANTVNTTSGAFNRYRIEIDAAGNALFYIDGNLVATILLAVATTAVLCPSVGMFSEATTGSQTLDIDYLLTQSNRV